jgi:hypothetical protein
VALRPLEDSAGPSVGWPDEDAECPRCGTQAAPGQEYCLECGLRLPAPEPLVQRTGPARFLPDRGAWMWPVLVGFVVALVAAAAVVTARATGGSAEAQVVATTPMPDFVPATEPEPAPAEQVPTLPPEQPDDEASTPPQPAPPPVVEVVDWPEDKNGWTIVLASLPATTGRAEATARARRASRAGLDQVGVIDSSRYASLHAGYFVIFSGIYDTRAEAEQNVRAARARGYDAAYVREIAS